MSVPYPVDSAKRPVKRRLVTTAALLVILIVAGAGALSTAEAQVRLGWSQPFQLSNPTRSATEATLVADAYGYVHAFWSETLPNQAQLLQYARFDGQTWSLPIAIRRSGAFVPIKSASAAVDAQGVLHLIWVEGMNGPVLYSSAPAYDALASQNWQRPRRVKLPADEAKLEVDSQGNLHILYKVLGGASANAGIYYVRSTDEAASWSSAIWLDPDILSGFTPGFMQFELGADNSLHAAWFYVPTTVIEGGASGDMIRYSHSLDGGLRWSQPYTIARNGEVADELGVHARPYMAVAGQTVHIIWAAGEPFLFRHHRYSADAGVTWSPTARIFGNLNGHAGDGWTVDGLGRFHFFTQIRFPQGIYHAVWDVGEWTAPTLIYLIKNQGSEDANGPEQIPEGIVHAHRTYPVVRAGNQLVLTFTDPPPEALRRLFVIERTLADVPAATLVPIPSPAPAASPPPPTASPTLASTAPPSVARGEQDLDLESGTSPASFIAFGVLLPLVLLAIVFAVRLLQGQRHPSR